MSRFWGFFAVVAGMTIMAATLPDPQSPRDAGGRAEQERLRLLETLLLSSAKLDQETRCRYASQAVQVAQTLRGARNKHTWRALAYDAFSGCVPEAVKAQRWRSLSCEHAAAAIRYRNDGAIVGRLLRIMNSSREG